MFADEKIFYETCALDVTTVLVFIPCYSVLVNDSTIRRKINIFCFVAYVCRGVIS